MGRGRGSTHGCVKETRDLTKARGRRMKEEIRNKLSELIEMVPLEDLVFFKSVVNRAIDTRLQQASIHNTS